MTPEELDDMRANVAQCCEGPIKAVWDKMLSHIDAQAEQIESLESCLVTMNRCIADGVRGFVTKEEQGACYDLLEQAQARADALLANRPDPMRAELARLNELAGDAGACRLKAEMAEQHASQLRERLAKAESVVTLRRLQDEQRPWVAHNFPGREPFYPLLGAVEELGELAHAHLKALQGIRGTQEEHHAAKVDAVADAVIFLADYCSASGIDMQAAVEETWAKVKLRDWKANPTTGQTSEAALAAKEASNG